MPILNNPIDMRYDGRTHSQLIVSNGDAPAEKWLPSDATNATVAFTYAFGPEYNSEVVIPKGKVVAAAGLEYDPVTEKLIPRIKIAGKDDIPLGINHHNVYQTKRDRFSGNAPTIVTRDYIRLPLFIDSTLGTAKTAAASIKFGAMYAHSDENLTTSAGKIAAGTAIFGQYVCANSDGNLSTTADCDNYASSAAATLSAQIGKGLIVGQVMGIELDMPPAGYLEYFTEMTEGELAALIKQSREIPSPGRAAADVGTLNIDTFPAGTAYLKSAEDLAWVLKNFKQGIPFLTDGYFKARKDVTLTVADFVANGAITDIRVMGSATVDTDANTISASGIAGDAIFVKLRDKLCQTSLVDGVNVTDRPEFGGSIDKMAITVNIEDVVEGNRVAISKANYVVDYYNNMIVIYPTTAIDAKSLTITTTVLQSQVPGIPTGWDFPGCFGEARILLQR